MQKSKLQFKIQNFYFLAVVFSFAFLVFNLNEAQAAKLFIDSKTQEIGINQEFQVDLMLDAEGQDINAAEGKIIFPENLFELKIINDGGSIINFWVQKPAYIKGGGIEFSGVIPGGFSGVLSPYYKGEKPGKVFSMIFTAKKEGSDAVEIKNAKVLLNDGQGTPAELKILNLEFRILKSESQIPDSKFQIPKDTDPPELFTPEIANDPNVFDGKRFLVFVAEDKGSGVDRYEIAEKRGSLTQNYAELPWQTAESPYLLEDQNLKSYIYIKAVDKAGNSRIIHLPPMAPWYKKWSVYMFIVLGILTVLLLIRWLWRRYKRI